MEVLIYGSRKSGTTLLQRLLDGGDELFVHPAETKIKFFLALQGEASKSFDSLGEETIMHFFRAQKKNWDAIDNNKYQSYLTEHYKSVQSLSDYINLDLSAVKAAIPNNISVNNWAIKEVSGKTVEILNFFLTSYPAGKILMIVRDPRRIAHSVYREKKRSGTKVSFKIGWKIARNPYITIRNQSKFLPDKRIKVIFYENLVQNTSKVMKGVAQFLQISFSENLLKPTIFGLECIVPSSSKREKKVYNQDIPLYAKIKIWQFLFIMIHAIRNFQFLKIYERGLLPDV